MPFPLLAAAATKLAIDQLIKLTTVRPVWIASDHVDPAIDTDQIISGEDYYCQLWLQEMQWRWFFSREDSPSRQILFAMTRFESNGKPITFPCMVPLHSSPAKAAQSEMPLLQRNYPLTPLFPYQGGQIDLHLGVYTITSEDELTDELTIAMQRLEHLPDLVQYTGMYAMRRLAGRLVEDAESLMAQSKNVRIELGSQQALGYEEGIASSPGYFALIQGPDISAENFYVIDGRLVVRSQTADAETKSSRLVTPYLLFRLDKRHARHDWADCGNTEDLAEQVLSAAAQGQSDLARHAFMNLAFHISQSGDFTIADQRRLLETVRAEMTELEEAAELGDAPANEILPSVPKLQYPRRSKEPSIQEEAERELRSAEEMQQATKKRLASRPYDADMSYSTLTFECNPKDVVRVKVNGSFYSEVSGSRILDLDSNALARHADEAFAYDWRFKSKDQGMELYGKLFSDPEVIDRYGRIRGALKKREYLRLRFPSSRELLRVPIEFLNDTRDFLVLQYPLSRSLVGNDVAVSNRSPLGSAFLNDLHRQNNPLSVLLIASDTPPGLPHVDEEVRQVEETLHDIAEEKGISLSLKILSSDDATFEAVNEEISNGDYHIIHYAGHAAASEEQPENSCLHLWTGVRQTGAIKEANCSMLQRWFDAAESVRFVYLSCCMGAAQDSPQQLMTNNFLGIADSLIQARIPAVLGHRWPIVDSDARGFSVSFYRNLLRHGEVDIALLHARREAADHRDDRSWLSPILILQG